MTSINFVKNENEEKERDEVQGKKDKSQTYESSPSGTEVGHLNKWQLLHLEGKFNVYDPIPQEIGEPLPPLAVQWKEDAKRRFGNANSRNR